MTHAIATGIGHARNLAVVASGDAVIAIGGEWGTLTEIAFARRLERPVIALRSWSLDESAELETGITQAETCPKQPPTDSACQNQPSSGRTYFRSPSYVTGQRN